MVAKHLIQIIITGVQVVGKAFGQAVRQEIRMSQEAAKRSQSRSKFLLQSRKRLDYVLQRIGSNSKAIFYSHSCISVLFSRAVRTFKYIFVKELWGVDH